MTTRTLRAWLLAVAVLALLPGVAHACNEPTLMVSPESAGSGDPVQYAITGLTPGGAYELGIEGHQLASGTASSTVARGTFTMPDLGDRSTGVSVAGMVEHSDIEGSPTGGDTWPVSDNMHYRAPAPPPSSEQAPAPQTAPVAPVAAGAPGSRAPAVTSPSVSKPGEIPGPGAARPAGAPVRDRTPQARRAAPAAVRTRSPAVVVGDAAMSAAGATASRTPAAQGAAVTAAGKPARAAAARAGGEEGPIPAPAGGSARVEVTGGITPSVLVAALLLLLAGFAGGGFGFARVRSRSPAPWVPPAVAAEVRARDLLLEAELQEMVAEARAREALGEPEPARDSGPGQVRDRELVGGPSGQPPP